VGRIGGDCVACGVHPSSIAIVNISSKRGKWMGVLGFIFGILRNKMEQIINQNNLQTSL
jgi:thiamine transporter ThiT